MLGTIERFAAERLAQIREMFRDQSVGLIHFLPDPEKLRGLADQLHRGPVDEALRLTVGVELRQIANVIEIYQEKR